MKRCWIALGCASLILAGRAWADDKNGPDLARLPPAAAEPMDFQRDIQPIFARACVKCHGADKQKGGLRLDEGSAALKGGNAGTVIQPGNGPHSRLLHLVAGLDGELKMPPTGTMLTAAEVSRLRAWIDQGARWPKLTGPAALARPPSRHWAFFPPKRFPTPLLADPAGMRNPIDAFILSRLEKEKVSPSPEADRATLIRRLSLDLLGLPPMPAEVDVFIQDQDPNAYERLVDRLLASPHYGERWGRHWLDLARYADSDGFEKDTGRPHAWRWRHWVIDALNRDMPFDQFTIEQLAGDLLPGATVEQKVATGFHRNTLTNREGGVDQEQYRVEQVVDRVNTTARAFLGITLGCAQCHDHKFDPFSQREFYQLFAYFNSDREVDITAPLPAEVEPYQHALAVHEKKKAELQAVLAAYAQAGLAAAQQKWEAELKLPELRKLPAPLPAILLVEPAKRNTVQQKELAAYYSKIDSKSVELTKALADHVKAVPQPSMAQTLALGALRKTHLMIRGDFLRPGVEVEPGTPAVLASGTGHGPKTRLDLARWIVDPINPLTARVIVNWTWHKYFGRGLVATLEDFGTQGDKPSHPELLDWLATEFIRQNWSMKALHRRIVTSATYRQSSRVRPELMSRDPLNVWLARQNRLRLEAEVTRDSALAASGLLTRTIGGPSVRPPQPPGISELTYAGSARWVESTGPDRYRRGLYTWFQRTSPYPMLMTFDAPDANLCCVRRERSNTPLQALTLLNDTVFVECAQALGQRIIREPSGSLAYQLRYGFRLCLGREPSASEQARLARLYDELLQTCRARPDRVWMALARTLMNLDEFVTRE